MPKIKTKTKAKTTRKRKPLASATALTSREAAALLGCSKELVIKLAGAGKLSCWRVGRDYRFSPEAIAAYKYRPA